jgi:hypothetical protein
MKRLTAVIAGLFIAGAASASLVTGQKAPPETPITLTVVNGALNTGTSLGGYVLPSDRGATFAAFTTIVYSASGGGAGNSVVRISDGTNNCDATMPCTDSQSTTAKRYAMTGTCAFAAGAALSYSVTTAGCTTTQPSVRNITFVVKWN